MAKSGCQRTTAAGDYVTKSGFCIFAAANFSQIKHGTLLKHSAVSRAYLSALEYGMYWFARMCPGGVGSSFVNRKAVVCRYLVKDSLAVAVRDLLTR
jgi:hypothetical protein